MVPASARETDQASPKRKVPPLAEASCGAINIRIAKATAKAMLRPFRWHLSEVRTMIAYPRKYNHDSEL
jgi:hypothetical protein